MMQLRADPEQPPVFEEGRRLAGTDSEYAQAMKSIADLVSTPASLTSNGMSGTAQLIVSTSLVLVLGSLAAGAGIGGGGLFVPIYMILLGAGPKGAVPLSKATILGGAIGNFISLSRARHPKAKTHPQAERPMIDYESSTLMQSGELLGVVFGVLLNNLLPAIMIVVFLVLILSYNSFKTFKKGFATRAKETKAFAKAAASGTKGDVVSKTPKTVAIESAVSSDAVAASAPPSPPPSPPSDVEAAQVTVEVPAETPSEGGSSSEGGKSEKPASPVSPEKGGFKMTPELQAIIDEDSKQFPLWAWALLAPMTIYTLLYKVIAKVIKNDQNCMDWAYWLWYVTPIPVLGGFMWGTAIILGKRHARKVAAGYPYLPADMQWDNATLKRFPFTALLAGVTAGLLGIGGGMVIGPLFLSIGMEPQVGTSSCAFMILWTAFSGVVIYGIDEHLGAELACWCVAFGIISGQLGQRFVNVILKKTGRPSYVVFLLASIIGAATIAMASTLIAKMSIGDYNADDVVEPDERPETHLFYLGSGFGCKAYSNMTA